MTKLKLGIGIGLSCIGLAVLLLTGTASAQIGSSSAKPAKKTPSTLEEVIAAAPFRFSVDQVRRMKKANESGVLAQKGENEANQGNWTQADIDYQQALALLPSNQIALYGLGDHAQAEGDTQSAIEYYRQAIYDYADAKPPALPPFGESNAYRVMEYAVLLSEAGQQEEAVRVYNRGAYLSDYMGGHPRPRPPLPEFGTETGQIAYTPQRLQALADVGWAIDHVDFDREGAKARLEQAVKLFPDSPLPYFYRARHILRTSRDRKAASADFDKAAHLGDPVAADAVDRDRHFYHLAPPTPAAQKP